jgi:hypothetical protein
MPVLSRVFSMPGAEMLACPAAAPVNAPVVLFRPELNHRSLSAFLKRLAQVQVVMSGALRLGDYHRS